MFTSLSSDKHKVYFNSNNNKSLHQNNYVCSIFNYLKKNNLKSAMFVGKDKFQFIDLNYSQIDDNIDEIDFFFTNPNFKLIDDNGKTLFYSNGELILADNIPIDIVLKFIDNIFDYNFIHFKGTDAIGHSKGWHSKQYIWALKAIDNDIGFIMNKLNALNYHYHIILTSDHGSYQFYHHDNNNPLNFTIPFYYFNNNKKYTNNDLYLFNPQRISPPNNINPTYNDKNVCIRNGDSANFILSLFKLKPILDSNINHHFDLKV